MAPSVTLDEIVAHKHAEVAEWQAEKPFEVLRHEIVPLRQQVFKDRLLADKPLHLILEVKPKSPSAGQLVEQLNIHEVLDTYQPHASGLSVLADHRFFGGGPSLLKHITQLTPHPILYKDFVIDPYQVLMARWAWADAVLLIVKILSDAQLDTLYHAILDLGMTPIVEVQTEDETRRAVALGAEVLLINNRNLSTFTIDLDTTARLAPQIPDNRLIISASGVESLDDLHRLKPFAQRFLVGSSLMRRPADQARTLLQSWRDGF
jgi:indole-3-glycerol phosphate synthase / phosphoribosylanthranilate isomerase